MKSLKFDRNSKIRAITGLSQSVDFYRKELKEIAQNLDIVFTVGSPKPGVVELVFLNTRFFRSGSDLLTKQAEKFLELVAYRISKVDQASLIEIVGHTDSDPIRSLKFRSNWDLSAARAASVVSLFARHGINPKRMTVAGRAQFEPIVPEKDKFGRSLPYNKAMNRRVVVRISKDQDNEVLKLEHIQKELKDLNLESLK